MGALYMDNAVGPLPYGSWVLSIGGSSYIADEIEVTRPSKRIERLNEKGEPASAVAIADWVTGTATLQLATTASIFPIIGSTFTGSFNTGSIGSQPTAETFYITEVGGPYSSGADTKARISFVKKYNS